MNDLRRLRDDGDVDHHETDRALARYQIQTALVFDGSVSRQHIARSVVAIGHLRDTKGSGQSFGAPFAHVITMRDGKMVCFRQSVDQELWKGWVASLASENRQADHDALYGPERFAPGRRSEFVLVMRPSG